MIIFLAHLLDAAAVAAASHSTKLVVIVDDILMWKEDPMHTNNLRKTTKVTQEHVSQFPLGRMEVETLDIKTSSKRQSKWMKLLHLGLGGR